MSQIPNAVAIDPMATILHGNLLWIYYLLHNPNTSPVETLEAVLRKATPADRLDVAARAKLVIEYGTAVGKVLAKTVPKTAAAK